MGSRNFGLGLRALACAATVTGALAAPTVAMAADGFTSLDSKGQLWFRSNSGNQTIAVTAAAGGRTVLKSTGTTVGKPGGCTRVTPSDTISCAGVKSLKLETQSGADTITVEPSFPADVSPGPGNDTVRTSNASGDFIYGATGNDVLDSAGGTDYLIGGDDIDTLDYGFRPNQVVVNLASKKAGVGAEGDTVEEFEVVKGGSGNDVLLGDEKGNILVGNNGADVLIGAGQADWLLGGSGDDTIGSGGDRFGSSIYFFSDLVQCGPDTDTVVANYDQPGADELYDCEIKK